MSDFTPYEDNEIVTFGLIPDGLAHFKVVGAVEKPDTGKGKSIMMDFEATGSGVSSKFKFLLHPKMMLTFKHFYQAAGLMSLFDIGKLPLPQVLIGLEGDCIVSTEIGKEMKDKPGQFWYDKNVVDDFLYPGYDPLRHTKTAPSKDPELDGQADVIPEDEAPF